MTRNASLSFPVPGPPLFKSHSVSHQSVTTAASANYQIFRTLPPPFLGGKVFPFWHGEESFSPHSSLINWPLSPLCCHLLEPADEAFKRGNWQVSRRTRLHGRTRRRRQSTTFSRPSRPFLRPGRPPSFPPSSAPYLAKSSLPRMKRQRRRTTPRRHRSERPIYQTRRVAVPPLSNLDNRTLCHPQQ